MVENATSGDLNFSMSVRDRDHLNKTNLQSYNQQVPAGQMTMISERQTGRLLQENSRASNRRHSVTRTTRNPRSASVASGASRAQQLFQEKHAVKADNNNLKHKL